VLSLHEKPTASSTTQHGTVWFCGQKPSYNFFCPDEESYMMTKAVEAFRKSGNLQPICPAHQKHAKIQGRQWRNYYGLRPGEPGGPQPQWAKWGPPALGDRAKTLARASDMLQCRFLTIKIL
jgi:hypothetical protein